MIDTDTDANMQMRINEGFWGTSGGHYASELGAAAVLAGGAGLLDISPTGLAQKMGLTSGALLEQWPQMEWMQEPSKPQPRVVTADHIQCVGTVANCNNLSSMIHDDHNVSYIVILYHCVSHNVSTWSQLP